MAKFEFNIPDGYRPIVENIERCFRCVRKGEYCLLGGEAVRWDYNEPSFEPHIILEKIETLRPFKDEKEFEPFADKWISRVDVVTGEIKKGAFKIFGYDENGVFLDHCTHRSYSFMFHHYKFKDGTPFGINE